MLNWLWYQITQQELRCHKNQPTNQSCLFLELVIWYTETGMIWICWIIIMLGQFIIPWFLESITDQVWNLFRSSIWYPCFRFHLPFSCRKKTISIIFLSHTSLLLSLSSPQLHLLSLLCPFHFPNSRSVN